MLQVSPLNIPTSLVLDWGWDDFGSSSDALISSTLCSGRGYDDCARVYGHRAFSCGFHLWNLRLEIPDETRDEVAIGVTHSRSLVNDSPPNDPVGECVLPVILSDGYQPPSTADATSVCDAAVKIATTITFDYDNPDGVIILPPSSPNDAPSVIQLPAAVPPVTIPRDAVISVALFAPFASTCPDTSEPRVHAVVVLWYVRLVPPPSDGLAAAADLHVIAAAVVPPTATPVPDTCIYNAPPRTTPLRNYIPTAVLRGSATAALAATSQALPPVVPAAAAAVFRSLLPLASVVRVGDASGAAADAADQGDGDGPDPVALARMVDQLPAAIADALLVDRFGTTDVPDTDREAAEADVIRLLQDEGVAESLAVEILGAVDRGGEEGAAQGVWAKGGVVDPLKADYMVRTSAIQEASLRDTDMHLRRGIKGYDVRSSMLSRSKELGHANVQDIRARLGCKVASE